MKWRKLRKLFAIDRGSIALTTALFLPAFFAMAGGVMDYAMYLSAKARLQAAADAAVLAMKPACSKADYAGEDELEHKFMRFFTANISASGKSRITIEDYEIYPHRGKNYIVAIIRAKTDTTFLRLFGVMSLKMEVESGAGCSGDGPGSDKLEVALAVDTSLSMRDGGKIDMLKKQAAFFVDELRRQRRGSIRVALLPFSQYVTVGMEYRDAWWINVPEDQHNLCATGGDSCPDAARYKHLVWRGKVGLRDDRYVSYDNNYRDHPVPGIMNVVYDRNPGFSAQGRRQFMLNNCVPTKLLPLTDLTTGRTTLVNRLEELRACGRDGMELGLYWSYRLLSFMKPFEGESDRLGKGKRVRKVVIMVTDGYVSTDSHDRPTVIENICKKIKAPYDPRHGSNVGIKDIITIVLPGAAEAQRRQMEKCANLGFYEVNNSAELRGAFDDIAWRLGTLPPRGSRTYLSH